MYTLMKPVGAGALGAEFPLAGEHGPPPQHLPQPPAAEGGASPTSVRVADAPCHFVHVATRGGEYGPVI